MREFALLSISVMLAVFSSAAFACKIRVVFPEHLDEDTPKNFYVVVIDKMKHGGFSGKVDRSFGGHFPKGRTVSVIFRHNEEAHAVCPMELSVGKTYLLHSRSRSGAMEISRFDGLNMSSQNTRFSGYVQDLENGAGR